MSGFIFIGDLINLKVTRNSIELVDNYVLRKAEGEEIDHIRKTINSLGKDSMMVAIHEGTPEKGESGNLRFTYEEERDKWNYWVIESLEFPSNSNFEYTISLCKKDLNRLFESHYNEEGKPSGVMMQYHKYYNFLDEIHDHMYAKNFSEEDAEDIKNIYNLIRNFKEKEENYPYIKKALYDYKLLKNISKRSPFFIVSMFSIIETLITNERNISHQLKTKLPLLNKRFKTPMLIGDHFKNNTASFETIISKLYDFRSDIAHGDFSNFEKELNVIESKEKATDFLYVLLKNVIIQALKEPDLISDLKKV